jgi:LysM repeat protein
MTMRSLAALLACLFLTVCSAAAAHAADPEKKPTDFRDLAWGAPPSALPGHKEVERDGDIVHYERSDEKKDVGGVSLRRVTYSFYKNKFYHAEIDYAGKDAADALQQSLEAKYGPPDAIRERTDPDGRKFTVAVWDWPGYAFIGNRQAKDGGSGRVFYFYAPLTDASAKAQGIGLPQAQKALSAGGGAAAGTGAAGYKVKKGDSLPRIAKRLGVSEEALTAANPGLSDKTLRAGDTIAVPGENAAPREKEAPEAVEKTAPPVKASPKAAPGKGYKEYTIKDGDVLSKVANAHGLATRDVLAANPGIDPKNLRPGMTIRIPAK